MEVCKDLESVYARTVVKDEKQPQSCEKRIELSHEGRLKNSFLPAGDIDAFRCRLSNDGAFEEVIPFLWGGILRGCGTDIIAIVAC